MDILLPTRSCLRREEEHSLHPSIVLAMFDYLKAKADATKDEVKRVANATLDGKEVFKVYVFDFHPCIIIIFIIIFFFIITIIIFFIIIFIFIVIINIIFILIIIPQELLS